MIDQSWKIGEIEIHSFIEVYDAGDVLQSIIPDATPQCIQEMPRLQPHYADSDGKLLCVVQSFLIQTPTTNLLVDTCIGNDR